MYQYWQYKMIGSGLMLLSVMLGAFGAHALKAQLAAQQLVTWNTACDYLTYQALGILFLSFLPLSPKITLSLKCLTIGIAIFSGSLLVITVYPHPFIGMLTPIGGLLLIAGWAIASWHCFRQFEISHSVNKSE